ncbi:efflux RND transporter periplasmic adaptor subunit [Neorhodopirellula pilleata]|nr:efflux RND transporter periplasmic adaptor subunit [Neorhodopirellula pilleata]
MFSTSLRIKLAGVILLSLVAAPVFAQTATYNDAYTIQGFSQPNRVSQVASATSGIILSFNASEGDRVRQGDCLVQLDHRIHDEKLELARVAKDSLGDLQSAEAELTAKNARLDRLIELSSRNHATAVELMQAQEDSAIARANVQRAKDRLAQATADHARLLAESNQFWINAPFDGVVVEFAKEVGEYVGPGEAVICTVAELDTLCVEFLLPRHYRDSFNVGDDVDVVFTVANETVRGTIQFISPFPNGETNTFKVKTRVDNSSGLLNAGERCQLRVNSGSPPKSDSPSNLQLSQHRL